MAAQPHEAEAEQANPALVTALCAGDLHYRCSGWVVTFPSTGRKLARTKCRCPIERCGHGPRPRNRPR